LVTSNFEVLDVVGELRAELLDLPHDRRDHVDDQEGEGDHEEQVGDQNREPARQRAPPDPSALDQVDERAQCQGEEDRGEQPADRRPDLDDHVLEQERDPDRHQGDRYHLEHGPGLYSRRDQLSSVS
jgi:hypothetical protein